MKRTVKTVVGIVLALGSAAPAAQRAPSPSLALESTAGRDSFAFYCASCHGADGRGDGPAALTLRMPPADLTTLAQRNGGQFPKDRVFEAVAGTGRALAAHGSTDMPVWGPIFRGLDSSEARNTQRLSNIVTYLQSLQRATTLPSDVGATLFRTHCASCHGTTARGNGPVADQLRFSPTDLTRFAARNGGVFPRNRVYDIVDGRGIPAHGITEMPVWGDVFRGVDAAVKARIEAIVGYLEAIQQRAG